jgi:hypothetical protein
MDASLFFVTMVNQHEGSMTLQILAIRSNPFYRLVRLRGERHAEREAGFRVFSSTPRDPFF